MGFEPGKQPGNLVTVAEFSMVAEAHIVHGRLEEEGIPATITDENIVAMAWHLSQAVGGIKVQVAPQDVERARDLLARIESQSPPDESLEDVPDPVQDLVRKALIAAFLGLAFPPIQLYSIWLILRIFVSTAGAWKSVLGKIVLALLLDAWVILVIWSMLRWTTV